MRFFPRRRVDTEQIRENWQPRLWALVIGLALLVAYAIAFVLENRKQINLHFVFVTASVSLIWLILLALAIGLIGGMLLTQLERRSRRRRRAQ